MVNVLVIKYAELTLFWLRFVEMPRSSKVIGILALKTDMVKVLVIRYAELTLFWLSIVETRRSYKVIGIYVHHLLHFFVLMITEQNIYRC